jgi:CheY-like chemotaxis protein
MNSIVRDRSTIAGPQGLVASSAYAPHGVESGEAAAARCRQAQKMETIGQLAGSIAHDFNNLLEVILGNGETLLTSLGENHPARTEAEAIVAAAQRAAGLTRQLLVFSRQQPPAREVTSLNPIVSGLEGMLRRLVGEDIELVVGLKHDCGDLSICADRGQIEQVLMNLVVNARDAMPTGGRLSVETGTATRNADLPERRDYATFAVRDTGCGMDEATKSRAFEAFFTTKDASGTGLGLATCREIVTRSGGFITIDSEPGQGSVFTVYLPTLPARPQIAAVSRRPAVSRPPVRLRGTEHILVVEDEAGVREVVQRILARAGYRVVTAASGPEALALAESDDVHIDLVIADVVMPRMTGPDVVKSLRRRRTGLKAILMTGYTHQELIRRYAVQEGMTTIQKPFTSDAIAAAVREVLDA